MTEQKRMFYDYKILLTIVCIIAIYPSDNKFNAQNTICPFLNVKGYQALISIICDRKVQWAFYALLCVVH